jgi:hypothetical protein
MRAIVRINFVVAWVAVISTIMYGFARGWPMAEWFMGFSIGNGYFPVWLDVCILQLLLLVIFIRLRKYDDVSLRVIIGGVGVMGLALTLVLPLLLTSVGNSYRGFECSPDRLIWWYACFSYMLCGLLGMSPREHGQGPETQRFARFSRKRGG